MTALLTALSTIVNAAFARRTRSQIAIAAMLLVLPLVAQRAFAQATTTISGTVYDPRTTASALPLPNVLVYVTTGTVDPFPSGVQCLTAANSAVSNAVVSATTAVDGTFTLTDVPTNTSYTLVIQAGKWRRQFPETVGTSPLTGLALHMPSDHTQGDIPMIAIATGAVDALECVFLDMGIAQSEFTDDTGTVNPGGHIHLYAGSSSPGSVIGTSTPNQTTLMNSPSLMNGYDVLMFPCQGNDSNQATTAGEGNLLNFANAGGRVFTTHYSYVWLNPNTAFTNGFPPVANWNQNPPEGNSGAGTIDTSFTDGATLAQWLQNASALDPGTTSQIVIGTIRGDVNTVIPPTQSWLTLNTGEIQYQVGNPVLQMTFNAPVGAPAANQCGRVVFNDYHVFAAQTANTTFPAECAGSTLGPQEEMLEYALFDLSSFVTPVTVPTLTIAFNPSPLTVVQGDASDQVTVNVTNTSTTTEILSTLVLTLTLPQGLTATAITDSTGGWNCNVGTLTCTRNSSLGAGATDSVTLTLTVPPSGGTATSGQIVATASSPNFSNNVTATDNVTFKQVPPIVWPTPGAIVFGTALGAAQLDATSTVAGSFSYSPAAGTVLAVGQHTLTANFTPANTSLYATATAGVTLSVVPITPTINLTANANPILIENPVTFTVNIPTVANTPPTGTVAFYDSAAAIGTATLYGGLASITVPLSTSAGNSITAVYSGDSNYAAGTSAALTENVLDFSITAANGGIGTGPASSLVSFPIIITPLGSSTFPSAISLSVTGLSLGSTASFSQSSLPAGSGATTVTLNVQLPGNAALKPQGKPFGPGPLPLAWSLVLLPFAFTLRKGARRLGKLALVALAAAALALGVNGCGSNPKLNPESYTLTVTGTSGNLSHTTAVTLTVK